MKKFTFIDEEGLEIVWYKWEPRGKEAKGVIQIAHGMTETALRYDYFAERLSDEGFVVYANDHRGHGYTAKCIEELGYVADSEGFNLKVRNMKQLTDMIKKENDDLPIILFGHSMGSFLSQKYVQLYGGEINGLILSGSNGKPYAYTKLGIVVSKIEMMLRGRKAKSKLMDKLSFGNFNSTFKPNRTQYDWLCSVEEEVDKYISDDRCGFICTTSFYYDLLKGIHDIHKKGNNEKVPEYLPIYIFSGDKDPVGYFGKGVMNLYNGYKGSGVKSVKCKLYKEGRHEMLNEHNKDEVIEDILNWINEVM